MELGTKFLFNILLRFVKPGAVCDIGSLDGSDAIRFKKILPASQVVLFEANPENYAGIIENPIVKKQQIIAFNELVWNEDAVRAFFIETPSACDGVDDHLRGMSSVFESESNTENKRVHLKGVRLDSKMTEIGSFDSIALWIDVEGGSYEVIEGITGIRDKVKLIHAEVETQAFWKGQKTRKDVLALAKDMGYVLLGHGPNEQQHDIVLIDKNLMETSPLMFKLITRFAFLRTIRIKKIPMYIHKIVRALKKD